jgi:predicted HicB family RNase H-like nuclease
MLAVPQRTYSGKLVARLGPDLHRHLATIAKSKGISLNDLIVQLLAGGSNFKLPDK